MEGFHFSGCKEKIAAKVFVIAAHINRVGDKSVAVAANKANQAVRATYKTFVGGSAIFLARSLCHFQSIPATIINSMAENAVSIPQESKLSSAGRGHSLVQHESYWLGNGVR